MSPNKPSVAIGQPKPLMAQAPQLAPLIDEPQQAQRRYWTAKAFNGYISEKYQIQCSDETLVRFFHKQGVALKTPQPWPDKQDEPLREAFLQKLQQRFNRPDDEADKSIPFQRTNY
jgi:transposase